MAYELIKYKKEFNDEIREFQCQLLSDLTSLPVQTSSPKAGTGSLCLCEEDANVYILKTNGTWVALDPVTISTINDLVTGGLFPLSAEMGKALKTLVDSKIAQTDIADNLTTDSSTKVASAKQVKLLDENKVDKTSITNLTTATDGQVLTSNGDGTSTFEIWNSDSIEPGVKNKYYTDELADGIKGTTQTVTFNADGTVQKIQHKNISDVVLREDVFTYATNLITEVRTLSTLETITFKYHTDTLTTEVI